MRLSLLKTSAAALALTDDRAQIRVLQQMTQLIMVNPERLREKTEEQKDTDQTNWVCNLANGSSMLPPSLC
jgi:hypothetical protein